MLSFPSHPRWRREISIRLQKRFPSVYPCVSALLVFLLPSFVQRWLWPDSFPPRRLYSTSWLDGLRGVAAIPVVLLHHTSSYFHSYNMPYGFQNEGEIASPIQLPFIRVIYGGDAMVHLFFIISGFAISIKPLQCARSGNYDALLRTVASSLFRRGIRIFLPVLGSFLVMAIFSRLGWVSEPAYSPSLTAQLWEIAMTMWTIAGRMPWSWDDFALPPYNYALWSLPIEYSCSLLLLLTLTGLSRLKTHLRFAFLLAMITCCFKAGHWGVAEFLVGMGLAEINLIGETTCDAKAEGLPLSKQRRYSWESSTARLVLERILVGNLIVGLFIAGWTNEDAIAEAPGYSKLYSMAVEPYRSGGGRAIMNSWLFVGAVQIMFALQQIKLLQRPFVTPLAQYLGDISFSIYIVHLPWIRESSPTWMPYVWALVGGPENAGILRQFLAWLLSVVALLIPVMWSGDIFWRLIDAKSVGFARWLEAQCIND